VIDMSNNVTDENGTVDMSLPYAMQMGPLASAIVGFLRSKSKTFTTQHDLSGAYPEHNPATKGVRADSTYTRSQVKAFVTRMFSLARNHGAKYASGVPDQPSQAAMIEWLGKMYEVTRGDNKGQRRVLAINAVAGVRRQARIDAQKLKHTTQIAEAVASGETVYSYTDAKGNTKQYTSINKAAKAYCRDEFGSEWYAVNKAENLAAGIAHFTPSAGIEVVSTMSSAKVIGVAKKAGAPSDVTTGKGAAARSQAWCLANADAVTPHLE
jgi:hypothetical protein